MGCGTPESRASRIPSPPWNSDPNLRNHAIPAKEAIVDLDGRVTTLEGSSGGGGDYTVVTYSSSDNLAVDDFALIDTTGGSVTMTLPAATGNGGKRIIVSGKHGSWSGTLTVQRAGSDSIIFAGGATASSHVISSPGRNEYISDGSSKWYHIT